MQRKIGQQQTVIRERKKEESGRREREETIPTNGSKEKYEIKKRKRSGRERGRAGTNKRRG